MCQTLKKKVLSFSHPCKKVLPSRVYRELEQVGAARPGKYCFFNTLLHTLRPKECTLSAFKSFSVEYSLLLHHALKEPRIPSVKMPEAYLTWRKHIVRPTGIPFFRHPQPYRPSPRQQLPLPSQFSFFNMKSHSRVERKYHEKTAILPHGRYGKIHFLPVLPNNNITSRKSSTRIFLLLHK